MAVIRQSKDDIDNDPAKIGTQYSVRNPHPGFGTDPNIINEYGHTHYPKYVDHPTKKQVHFTETSLENKTKVKNRIETDIPEKVLVQNEEEEKALLGKIKGDWTKDKK